MSLAEFMIRAPESCKVCGHTEQHAFNVTGKTECKACPEGLCISKAVGRVIAESPTSLGFNIIREMNKADLVEEILLCQRENLMKQDMENLRRFVVQIRVNAVQKRLMDEAGIEDRPFGFFGGE